MKTIVITGPSGSGKSYLSNKLTKLFNNSIIIKTDSYYRDDFYIKLLSIFIYDIYDRFISIKDKCLIKTITSIYNKDDYPTFYNYDFRSKRSTQLKRLINYHNNNSFLILEGIFSHRLDIDYEKTINIICQETKDICYERRLIRDRKERKREKNEIIKRFEKSWNLYHQHLNNYIMNNKVIYLNKLDLNLYGKLINNIKNQGK